MFGLFKKKTVAPPPVPHPPPMPKPRLRGFPVFTVAELVEDFGITPTEAEGALVIYEGLVAGDVRQEVAMEIRANPRNAAIITPLVTEVLKLDRKHGDHVGRWLSFVAITRDNLERALDAGITHAKWSSGDWTDCTSGRTRHAKLDEKRYKLADGLKIGENYERPGVRPGCKCHETPVVEF